jgi:hypothetical protein
MARFILPDGVIVQDGQPFVLDDVQYPNMGFFSADERTALGIVEVVEQPMPDPRYFYSTEDPAHPGQWIATPIPAEQLKASLIAYAATVASGKQTGGLAVGGNTIATDLDSQNRLVSFATAFDNGTLTGTVKVKIVDASYIDADAALFSSIYVPVMQYIQTIGAVEASTVAAINAGTVATYEAIDAAFAAISPPPSSDPQSAPPRLVAAAYGVTIVGGDIPVVEGSFNVAAALYAGVGTYYLFFSRSELDTAYFTAITGGAPSMQVTTRDVDFLIVEAKDSVGGAAVDPSSFNIEIKRL